MKKVICIVGFLFLSINSYSQQGDPIKDFPGIPIITYMGVDSPYIPPYQQFQKIDSAGIFALQMANLTKSTFDEKILLHTDDLLVMPEQIKPWLDNYIYKYTEARYTEFEAEGTNINEGRVTLYHDSIDCEIYNGAVRTIEDETLPGGTLIYGPMYSQEVIYSSVDPGDTIDYTAKYYLKLEDLQPGSSSPNDTICVLRVTTSRTWDENLGWGFWDTKPIKEVAVTYGQLQPFLGQWKDIDLSYNLLNIPDDFLKTVSPPYTYINKSIYNAEKNEIIDRVSINCIEFKLIWKGNPHKVRLSVDKIIVFDDRGWDLWNEPEPEYNIFTQLQHNQADFPNRIAGWIGLDEPWSLDTWGPIRKISEIIDNHSSTAKAKMYFQFNPSWNGRFGDYGDVARASKVIMIDEFMRRVKKANVWINGWLYDVRSQLSAKKKGK